MCYNIIVLASCYLDPPFQDVNPDDWFTVTFVVNCNNRIAEVVWYTSGYSHVITDNRTIAPHVRRGQRTMCNDRISIQNYSISIHLTHVVHQHLNEVITARGRSPQNTSLSCTSLPSARYYLKQNFDLPGQSAKD